ncbi:putative flavin-containing protein YtfP [Candidatus Syntrophocurvum alkaliphilum]|uniref:Putative flavin-containing protein YtfP n=1 Tax=Candidatus Syntrophocurvum alkaliphilum TaxID=2293317 RepID=A0A6I6DE71_9FIRM|nr:NAD(P)/FAD-dependent oxidoreductase [Candidatus Syntrophocurvum alkaliphilum]QGU00855.1 putative flavin-containing protein YtfP [Candidatus Syntrophocurvum alkaliphilum]
MKKIIIVGAGPAGMMAAIKAAKTGANVILLEKKEKVGRKLRITGKGRCNITSALELPELIKGYPGNGRFLYSSLNEFSNKDLIEYFKDRGLKTKVERGARVFPESDNADDVVNTLLKDVINSGVTVLTAKTVTQILIKDDIARGVKTKEEDIAADAVIIATGGKSYPGTGSTGDGYRWAEQLGHNIINPRPGLVPLVTQEKWIKELQGLTLKNIKAKSFDQQGEKINEDFGEMLFTHFGISGPIILSMSREIALYIDKKNKNVQIIIDLKPALSEEKLDERIQREFLKNSRKQFKNSLDDLLPQKLIPVIIKLSKISSEKECNSISRNERKNLVYLLKNLSLTVIGTRSIEEAIVTAGGVDVKEINPKNLQSKKIKNLYFAGEVIDVDGYTGGFNLQAAFSTGYVAGKNAGLM